MDLSLFLTTQASQTEKGAVITGRSSEEEKDFDLFFKTLLQGGLIEEKGTILSDPSIYDPANYQDLNTQLSNSIASLEALFSSASDSADILELQEFMDATDGRFIFAADNGQLHLSDAAKQSLLDKLMGTPLSALTAENISSKTSASPFADTEATLDGQTLFEKILQNLNQKEGTQLSLESLIAAGLSPQQLSLISDQTGSVTLSAPAENEYGVLSDDLIALLGLAQNAASQTTLSRPRASDPLPWFKSEEDGAAIFKDIKAMEALKAAIQQASQAGSESKATQMMAGAANQNVAEGTFPVLLQTASAENFMEWFDSQTQQWTSVLSLPSALNGTNLTSTLVHAQQAGSAHPATQMVVASFQKNSSGSDSRNWTLQLDPPDLGKVEVRLTFQKDKSVKAQMVIEKPETWMMLQRDAQILERALQNAGLDVDSSSIGFELAENPQDFSHNGSHNGQGSGENAGMTGEETEIIETTMTWFTDPESGTWRYDLVV